MLCLRMSGLGCCRRPPSRDNPLGLPQGFLHCWNGWVALCTVSLFMDWSDHSEPLWLFGGTCTLVQYHDHPWCCLPHILAMPLWPCWFLSSTTWSWYLIVWHRHFLAWLQWGYFVQESVCSLIKISFAGRRQPRRVEVRSKRTEVEQC